MDGKSDEAGVESMFAGQSADVNVFHPVVKNLFRNTAEKIKCPNMTIQEGGQITGFDELCVYLARVAQDHCKQV